MNDDIISKRHTLHLHPNPTNRQLAAFLNLSVRQVQRLREDGTLQARIDAVARDNVVPLHPAAVARDRLKSGPSPTRTSSPVTSPLTETLKTASSLTESPTTTSSPVNVTPDVSSATVTPVVPPDTSSLTTPTTVTPNRHWWTRTFQFASGLTGWIIQTGTVMGAVGWLNVWPKVSAILDGRLDASNWSLVSFQIFMMFLMTQIWPAIRQVCMMPWHWMTKVGSITALVLFGSVLVATNITLGIDSIGLSRDSVTDKNADIIKKKSDWESDREVKKAERAKAKADREKIHFTPTSKDMLKTAESDFADAKKAKEASNEDCRSWFGSKTECNRVRSEFEQRHQKLLQVQADDANQTAADKLDTKISGLDKDITDLTTKIDGLGVVPEHKDGLATRFSAIGWTEEDVAVRIPIIWASVAESSALWGPFILDLSFAFLMWRLRGRRHG
jgi:hypothetical protein